MTAVTGDATADVKLEGGKATTSPASTGKDAPVPASKKRGDSMYHERAGCGLFWALGRFRPTNYMIVRPCLPFFTAKVDSTSLCFKSVNV